MKLLQRLENLFKYWLHHFLWWWQFPGYVHFCQMYYNIFLWFGFNWELVSVMQKPTCNFQSIIQINIFFPAGIRKLLGWNRALCFQLPSDISPGFDLPFYCSFLGSEHHYCPPVCKMFSVRVVFTHSVLFEFMLFFQHWLLHSLYSI